MYANAIFQRLKLIIDWLKSTIFVSKRKNPFNRLVKKFERSWCLLIMRDINYACFLPSK